MWYVTHLALPVKAMAERTAVRAVQGESGVKNRKAVGAKTNNTNFIIQMG